MFTYLDFTLLRAVTGQRCFPKEVMVCALCEGSSQITDLADYLNNNRLIAHYCGFDITEPLPPYWTYDRFFKQLDNGDLREVMAQQVKKLYEFGHCGHIIYWPRFYSRCSEAANTRQNNPKPLATDKFKPENLPKPNPDCALGAYSASNQHNERRYEFYWRYKNHVLVDCISGLPLYELTTPANVADPTVVQEILAVANSTLHVQEFAFLGDKSYDVKAVYDLVKDIYNGKAVIPLNKRNTKDPDKLPADRPLCPAGLAMHKGWECF